MTPPSPAMIEREKDKPTSMDGAAGRLGISRRTLQDWLKAHPLDEQGEPYYCPW
jgi:hypothetical protein